MRRENVSLPFNVMVEMPGKEVPHHSITMLEG